MGFMIWVGDDELFGNLICRVVYFGKWYFWIDLCFLLFILENLV